jgi:hypothetical protein
MAKKKRQTRARAFAREWEIGITASFSDFGDCEIVGVG